ncbi:MAG: radical SAM protein [Acidobacteriota bacterium]|nr:radical SAM protein [Acidobacteriota bacterium]
MLSEIEAVEDLARRNPDIPFEAIVKEDLLRRGMAWSPEALAVAAEFKRKSYFIFSFDMAPISGMGQGENLKVPEEVRLSGGPHAFKPVVVSVRINPDSPYRVEAGEGGLSLELAGAAVAGVELQKTPGYYRKALSGGRPVSEVVPTIEWGYLLYLTAFRLCQYPAAGEGCLYCDINENYRQQKDAGRPCAPVKTVDEMLEALEVIAETEDGEGGDAGKSKAYTVTGGSVTGTLQGLTEADFYLRYPEAIERRWPGRWISKVVVEALPKDEVRRFRDAGVRIYHPNFEIWDKRLFEAYCPGKARHVGRDEWLRRIVDAAEVFGPENVIPNFVAGVEMAPPGGFATVEDAIASTSEGLEFFMSRGISPRFTSWCPEPLSALGKARRGAPLEYYVRLLRVYRDTRAKYRLASPCGYGEPGLGRAVFSVSSFMDVLPPEPAPHA